MLRAVRFPLEGKERRDVDTVPRGIDDGTVLTLDEANIVLLAVRTVILGNLHQPEGWVLVAVTRFHKKDVLVRHILPRFVLFDHPT